ncbi:hypothetical protein PVK06_015731 [Gossypium arboreum]|uniref:Small VCP/p97-interacting protein n=1 Tax=Gossypium arboreum TaxID=29729 RepID=A0ABR0PYS3_GOSAR|nr:hypothetical protein PVK06_015731 [Gossypium arboreum]
MGCFSGCFSCFDGGNKEERQEQDRLASAEARAKAAEAAQKRQEQFEQSAAGRAARAQVQAAAKQSANSNKGEPVLKGECGGWRGRLGVSLHLIVACGSWVEDLPSLCSAKTANVDMEINFDVHSFQVVNSSPLSK